jgi:hypothetical protein
MRRARPAAWARRSSSDGAALIVELIISSTMVLTAFAMAASLSGKALNGIEQTDKFAKRDAAVNADLAELRSRAARYSFCDGTGTLAPTATSCLKQGNPISDYRSEDYFSPYNPDPSSESAEQSRFLEACDNPNSDQLTAELLKDLNKTSTYASQLSDAGISRKIENDTDSGGSGPFSAHRLRVTYSGTKVDRTVLITPTVAAWCP